MAREVFISHSSHDKVHADAICARLESHGIRCWRAPRDIRPGMEWGAAIVEAIDSARMMLLVFSSNANSSPQISREVERAVHKGVPVIPVRVEDVAPSGNLEYFLGTPHWLDAFTPPFEQHLDYIADSTKYWLERPANDVAGSAGPQVEPRNTQLVDPIRVKNATVAIPKKPEARSKRVIALGAGALLFVLIAIAAGVKLLNPRSELRATPGIDRSLAVLPLENFSGDPNQEYFADGMTDELITELSNIGGLSVISRTSVMQYKGERKETLPQIARALNVSKVVEGSVTRIGEQVRITVQLIDAPTDKHIWAKSYESESKDVLKLQATLASEIASQIKVELTPAERTRLADAQSVNPEAYEAYLKGRYAVDQTDPNALLSAGKYLERAIELDPNFSPAYASLSQVYALGAFVGPPSEAMPLAKAAAQKAVELNDNLAEAHSALASVMFQYDFDWAGSEREFRRALELNPSYALAHAQYGMMLAAQRRLDDGELETARGHQLDPYSVGSTVASAYLLTLKGDFDAAREQSRKTLNLNPTLFIAEFGLGFIDVEAGRFNDAIPELIAAGEIQNPTFVAGFLGYAYAASGQRDKAQKILDQLNSLSTKEYVSPFAVAQIYLGLGDRDRAMEWLEKAYKAHSPWMLTVGVSRIFDPLRGDARFAALVKKMGLHRSASASSSSATSSRAD